ncbi:hypothetical protein ONE63_011250 [Megalurothrips usitatus]|uniref:cholesterol 7-desaturase n=1 Tax=Megalurothrips usitatus TaxID=439358 RepID=A0AAV7X3Z6_9NEOP|nr:hypothetical protein ONE63_011250 [Megalurothrips usitatus]
MFKSILLHACRLQDLHDVGFEAGSRLWGARRRVGAAADALRRRRVGGLPPVFPNGWFAVLESCLLARGVHHVTALGLNLAVFRGESGRVRVLDAYCPHMGANMAVGGRVRGDCLECPFHNWCFDGRDGKCTAVPYSQKVPELAKVRCWECRDVNGFVFVWFHAEGAPPAWEPQPVVAVDSASWAFAGRNEFLAACHIQEIPENGADVSHFNCLHGPGIGIPCLSRF